MNPPTSVAELRQRLEATLRPLLPGSEYALLDFPDYANPGDSAIWLGERRVLQTLTGRRPLWVASRRSYDPARLRMLPRSAPLLLQGGGNLGDLWPVHQVFRERVLADAPDRPVVVLAQSVCFRGARALESARRAFGAHRDLTLLLRDHVSLQFAQTHFQCRSQLCPDFAFALNLPAAAGRDRPGLWLARADREATGQTPQPQPDWIQSDWHRSAALNHHWLKRLRRWPATAQALAADRLAQARLAAGLRLLRGRPAVVTDRLHGHVLALLLGIPNVLLPDAFGKTRALHETWTRHLPGSAFADSPAQVRAHLEALT